MINYYKGLVAFLLGFYVVGDVIRALIYQDIFNLWISLFHSITAITGCLMLIWILKKIGGMAK